MAQKELEVKKSTEADQNLAMNEKFGEPDYGSIAQELSLYKGLKWTIWEYIEYDQKEKNKDWEKKMRKVAWFDNMIQFHQAWNKIVHAKVSNVMFDIGTNQFKL